MGTRGSYGLQKGDKRILQYNHWDSYPSGLGLDILNALIKLNRIAQMKHDTTTIIDLLSKFFDNVKTVNEDKPPTKTDYKKYQHLQQNVNAGEGWYSLLRSLQGDLYANYMLNIFIEDGDTGWQENRYIINLDTKELIFMEMNDQKEGKTLLKIDLNNLFSLDKTIGKGMIDHTYHDEIKNLIKILENQ